MSPAHELLTTRHSFFLKVNKDTKVYFVGPTVKSVEHDTRHAAYDGIELAGRTHFARIEFEKPVHVAKPAGFCGVCNTLWVADNAPVVPWVTTS